jgi:hypothetical protein
MNASQGDAPLLLIAFEWLPVRAILYTLTVNTEALVAIQILDVLGRKYSAWSQCW